MPSEGIVRTLMLNGIKVYVNPGSSLKRLTNRVVLQPRVELLKRYATSYRFMLENLSFAQGEPMDIEEFVGVALEWCKSSNCELVVAPDKWRDPVTTLVLHMHYTDKAPLWLMRKSLAVLQEFRPSKILEYAEALKALGFRRLAIPSDNTVAVKMIKLLKTMFGYIHILGCQSNALTALFNTMSYTHVDSIDVYDAG